MEYKTKVRELKITEHRVSLSADDFRQMLKDKLPQINLDETDGPILVGKLDLGISTHEGMLYPGESRIVLTFIERKGTLEPEL